MRGRILLGYYVSMTPRDWGLGVEVHAEGPMTVGELCFMLGPFNFAITWARAGQPPEGPEMSVSFAPMPPEIAAFFHDMTDRLFKDRPRQGFSVVKPEDPPPPKGS